MELRACTGAEVRPAPPTIPDPSATDRTTPSKHGPHPREYIVAKQQVLRACVRERRQMAYAAGETAFEYRPPAEHSGAGVALPAVGRASRAAPAQRRADGGLPVLRWHCLRSAAAVARDRRGWGRSGRLPRAPAAPPDRSRTCAGRGAPASPSADVVRVGIPGRW